MSLRHRRRLGGYLVLTLALASLSAWLVHPAVGVVIAPAVSIAGVSTDPRLGLSPIQRRLFALLALSLLAIAMVAFVGGLPWLIGVIIASEMVLAALVVQHNRARRKQE